MVHWQALPVALAPTPGGPDEAGCYTGSAVDHDGVPTLIYTGIHPQVVCLATGSDDLVNWEKYPGNPVIAAPPEELAAQTGGQFRDPFVWKENGGWHMVIGSTIEGQGGLALHYRSDDLIHWEYLGILLQGNVTQTQPFRTGAMWECPNFFRLGSQHVLFFSVQGPSGELVYPVYYAGDYDGRQFKPVAQDILVHGNSFYAPQITRTEDGRTVMWGWLREERRQAAWMEAGWAGVMSLPMTLELPHERRPDGVLRIEPVEELKSLRREHWHFENHQVAPGSTGWLPDIQGDCLEIETVFEPDTSAEFGLKLLCSPDGEEQTRLVYDGRQERLTLELDESSLSTSVDRGVRQAPLSLDARDELRLHIFLDRSVLEVFANDHTCLAGRIYPTRTDSLGVDVFVRQGSIRIKSMSIWSLGSIWKE
jgi:beta-fructofuranosidase